MTPTYRRYIAAMGAVFAILATVSLMVYFFMPDLWGGALGVVSVFCYIITFALFFLIRLNNKKENEDNSMFNFPENESDNSKQDSSKKNSENDSDTEPEDNNKDDNH